MSDRPSRRLGVDFDAVAPLRPHNATAGRVASGGVHWDPEVVIPSGYRLWDAPPPMKRFTDAHGTDVNLTGQHLGRLTVVGVFAEAGSLRWVVRCACGNYELRTPKAIKAALNTGKLSTGSTGCIVCQYQDNIKKRYAKRGSRPLAQFVNGKLKNKRRVRPPPEVIASWIPGSDRQGLAQKIIKDLQQNGYRIVRQT